ncbi:(d)CMP kinase [Aliifodinibius salicampi]|uniref:Cytidylate kinase n=1 Tax=Fodinibius salicampi TaxID=1920655 RepID=A0ABT3PXE2_9BACT|nr:(d)CMP kinase [Fodinibius salicampi]MCW9712503.1 (d)CMP kinase [Fodinibius salicampi]
MIIVIDGPAGSGKSSTARAVADKLDIEYLDSGALYRTATLLYLEADRNEELFFKLLQDKTITFHYSNGCFHVAIEGESVTSRIRTIEVAEYVSEVAARPHVRQFVNDLMRDVVDRGTYIAEGRDLGTAVFPDADLKFYMSADIEERARRRYEERKTDNPELTLEQVKQNIEERDHKDSNRETDPLKKAVDAIEVDTTNLSFEQQVDKICLEIRERLNS